jgi:PAS domain S-box-containing protein
VGTLLRKALIITALISIILLLPVWLIVSFRYESYLLNEQNLRIEQQLVQKANILSSSIQKRFALLEGLHAFVLANPKQDQLDAKFSTFASALQTGVTGIRNFGLAPDGINAYVYPLVNNEKVIGHSLINDNRPLVKVDVQRALETKVITLSGPYLLRQGGLGLVARKAVFIDDEFWGLATMVVDMPSVLSESGLEEASSAKIGIRKISGDIFYGNSDAFTDKTLTKKIILPDGAWELSSLPQSRLTPPFDKQLGTFHLIFLIVSVLVILLIFSISSRQAYLTATVKDQTRDLEDELAERYRAEQALLKSEKRVKDLIESSPIGLALCDMDGFLLLVNPAYANIIGYSIEEILKFNYRDITLEQYAEDEKKKNEQLEKTGHYSSYEKEYRHKDGHAVPVRLNGMVVYRDGEKFIWSSVEDITALKHAEAEKDELAEQLRQSQKMEAIGTLAGGIAHDFNNILSAIIGYSQLSLADKNCDEKISNNINNVLSAAQRAGDLVRQILMFSRKEGQSLESLDIHTTVLEACKLIKNTIPTNVSIQLDMDSQTGTVFANPSQLYQIVMNLCTNAFHALPEQGGKISISLKPVTVDSVCAAQYSNLRTGRYALITVTDTGTGIPADILPRIFDPFFTTKPQGKGTGMGLSVVHGAVQNQGGAIGVKSIIGEGTTFKVFIPLAMEMNKVERKDEITCQSGQSDSGNILWVDDEMMLAQLGKETLELHGYHVTAISSALKALTLFQSEPDRFDLIITDQTMPEMTGDLLIKEVQLVRSDIPIIICTGHSSILTPDSAKKIGVNALLMKPLDSKLLINEVRSALKPQS